VATKLKDRVGVGVATVGTGTLALGAPLPAETTPNLSGWKDFAAAGVTDGQIVRYLILDANGAWEYGLGTYGASPIGMPDASNTGHLNAPGFTGLSAGGAVASGNTYNFLDYSTGITLTSISNVTFNGCRFQSNATQFANVRLINCNNIRFNYCSIVPLVSLHPQPTHPGVWPSAGVGVSSDGVAGYAGYMIPHNNGYQYGIRMEGATGTVGVVIDHCDIWGFGNAIDFVGAINATVTNSWIHDAADPGPTPENPEYHTDGPGYLDGGGGRSGITIDHCTIASFGNTNGIAFQAASSAYSNITVNNCFLSGFGYCVDMCHMVAGNNNLIFTNNTLATDVRWVFGPLYANFTTQFDGNDPTNQWSGNRLRVFPGTSPGPNSSFAFTGADDGKFLYPGGALSTTDYVDGHP
jgi:hypothetical protein